MRPMLRCCLGLGGTLWLIACGPTASPSATQPSATQPAATQPAATQPAATVEPPAYPFEPLNADEHERVCAGTGERPSPYECTQDSDCRICHDGSNCGTPVNLDEYRRRGVACQREDLAECEYMAVRCCAGYCRVVSH